MPKISLVDPPGPASSIKDLKAFLAKAKTWPKNDNAVQSAIRRVQWTIEFRRKLERTPTSQIKARKP